MNTAAVERHVIVFQDPRDGTYRIVPGLLTVRSGDKVIFHNMTQPDVDVQFLYDKSPFAENAFVVTPGSPNEGQEVTGGSDHFPYVASVNVDGKQIEAKGSRPIIIILD